PAGPPGACGDGGFAGIDGTCGTVPAGWVPGGGPMGLIRPPGTSGVGSPGSTPGPTGSTVGGMARSTAPFSSDTSTDCDPRVGAFWYSSSLPITPTNSAPLNVWFALLGG